MRRSLALVGLLVIIGAGLALPQGQARAAATPAAAAPRAAIQPLAGQAAALNNLNDYPWQGLYDQTLNCNTQPCADGWGMGYGECVSYLAWKSYEMEGGTQHPSSVPASGWTPSDQIRALVKNGWPDAGGWADTARNAGIPIDAHPFVGDVAQWNYNSNNGTFPVGHVAFVYRVNGDGSIELAQYNLREDGKFSTLHMPPGGAWDTSNGHGRFFVAWPDNFIHIGYVHMQGYSQFGSDRYRLDSDGSIWQHQGKPSGWVQLDNNPKTTAIAADGNGTLYQLHYDGTIWQYTGTGWLEVDKNPLAIAIAVDSNGIVYQLHTDGSIWQYTGPPITGWLKIDKNPRAIALATDGQGRLYQFHNDGSIWLYQGVPITGWQELDNNPKASGIAADGSGDLFEMHTDGSIWLYQGVPMTGWLELDNNPKAVAIAADGGGNFYQLHNDGSIWLYQGPPLTGWLKIDNNPKAVAIAADSNGNFYQLHNDGTIWIYTGPPLTGWAQIGNSPKTVILSGAY